MKKNLTAYLVLIVCALFLVSCIACNRDPVEHSSNGHDHSKEADERGPHDGKLLREGPFAVELKIFETGVPPRYRVYAFENEKAISPKDYSVKVALTRLGEPSEEFLFSAVDNFLMSSKEVKEPHSFSVSVSAKYKAQEYSWKFDSIEGRTTLTDEAAKHSGVQTEISTPRVMNIKTRVRGRILPSEHRIAHIIPRFSGLVREGRKHVGDKVEKGEVLAIIESNQSLQPFEVRSQISGTVINGHVIVGEFVPENQWIYVIADLTEVWADFFVPLRENISVANNQSLEISNLSGENKIKARLSYVAPYIDEKAQTQLVRAAIPNPDNQLLPGMSVLGDLVVEEYKAPIAIKQSALQTFRDWRVAFIKVGETYEVRPLQLGRSDGEWVEVLEGLLVGQEYVSENSFLIKADILKSGATHDH